MARKLKKLTERDKFYILTNGKQTEKNYFDLIKSKRSVFDVDVKYFNDDPYQLIKHAQSYIVDANQVWCVFDIDNSFEEGGLIPALKLAEETGVNIAFSNQAFEVWLISHFKKCNYPMNTSRHIFELNLIIKNDLGLSNKKYSKSDKNLLEAHFIPRYKQAITNCKIIHQNYIKEHDRLYYPNTGYRIWEWNSCSNVYELIEALQLGE